MNHTPQIVFQNSVKLNLADATLNDSLKR